MEFSNHFELGMESAPWSAATDTRLTIDASVERNAPFTWEDVAAAYPALRLTSVSLRENHISGRVTLTAYFAPRTDEAQD